MERLTTLQRGDWPLFKRDVVLAQEYLGLLLLNLFDLFLTGFIFRHEGQEANAAANFVLKHGGAVGFAIFKFLMVAFIVLLCEAISTKSVATARRVIVFGCVVYVGVVIYECWGIVQNIIIPTMWPVPERQQSLILPMLRLMLGW